MENITNPLMKMANDYNIHFVSYISNEQKIIREILYRKLKADQVRITQKIESELLNQLNTMRQETFKHKIVV